MQEKIKCPFCGGDNIISNGHYAQCETCGAEGPSSYPVPNREAAFASFANPRFILSAKEKELS